MKKDLYGIKWGLQQVRYSKRRLERDKAQEAPLTQEEIQRQVDDATLERLARVQIWLETKEAAIELDEAGQAEEAARLFKKAAALEQKLKEEDARNFNAK